MYVRDVGEGPVIIVVHGGPDFDQQYLLPDLDRLADSFHLVYYDQRGRGRSSCGVRPEDVTIRTEVEDLDAVRELFGLESVAVLGHSWGGLLAMEYAIRRPGRVSHLILMNTAPVSGADAQTWRRAHASGMSAGHVEAMTTLASSARYQAGDRGADADYYRMHFASALKGPDLLEPLIRRLRSGVTEDGIILARRIEQRLYDETWSSDGYDLTPQLERLRVPTLIIHGDGDLIPLEVVHHIADAIPTSRLVILEDCGHFAYLDQPNRVHSCVAELMAS
jgi:proline iminopeptidase